VRLLVADPVGREWLTTILYMFLEGEEYEYAFTFHNINVVAVNKPFAVFNGLPVPAAVGISEALRITMLIYYPLVSRLSHQSQVAMLKHEALHIVEGHMSSYGERLIEEYGPEVANIAKDLYVNQRLSTSEIQSLQDDGLPPQLIATYKFKPGLSSEQYCRLLQDGIAKGEIPPPPSNQGLQIAMQGVEIGEAGEPGQPGDPFEGKGEYRPSEVFDLSTDEGTTADQATREVLRSVTETLEARGREWNKARGFGGSDRDAFVEASKRQSRVPWHYFLRVAESRFRSEEVVHTKSRPSRRCPYHPGRVRKYGLNVAFMIDTSGSMGAEQLQLVDSELRGMHTRGAHIVVVHCDAAVAKIEGYTPFTAMERFYGRGGTDFSPALLAVRDMYPRPGLFVGFTDGFGGIEDYVAAVVEEHGEAWYEEFKARQPSTTPDGVEALWLIPEGCMDPEDFRNRICPWGQIIVVPAAEAVQSQE
jgi:predicted metal-dependent peptidase